MKKIIACLMLCATALTAFADPYICGIGTNSVDVDITYGEQTVVAAGSATYTLSPILAFGGGSSMVRLDYVHLGGGNVALLASNASHAELAVVAPPAGPGFLQDLQWIGANAVWYDCMSTAIVPSNK